MTTWSATSGAREKPILSLPQTTCSSGSAIEEYAARRHILDLGRADVRIQGLMRFKAELGAVPIPLPFSVYPQAPNQVNAEVLTGTWATMAKVWRRMPIFATAMAGRVVYRFLG